MSLSAKSLKQMSLTTQNQWTRHLAALLLLLVVAFIPTTAVKGVASSAHQALIPSAMAEEGGRSLGALRAAQKEAAEKARAAAGQQPAIAPAAEPGLITKIQAWLNQKQAEIIRTLSTYLTSFQNTGDASFAFWLISASFLYGLLHAAGPGHGKIVVSSYVLANNETMRRGILLAFLSAFVQGTVAVLLVYMLATIFNATGSAIKDLGFRLTQISYLLITALGIYLLGSTLYRRYLKPALAGHAPNAEQNAAEYHHHHAHTDHHEPHHHHDHHHHEESCGCGHKHLPASGELSGKFDLAKITSLVLSVGLRPCSGALFILAFALVKGLFWVGAVSVYAMALGTAITISAMMAATVAGRELAFLPGGAGSRWRVYVGDALRLTGAAVIIAFGLLLFTSTLGPVRPF